MSISIAEGTITMLNDNSIEQALRDLTSADPARKIVVLQRLRGVKDQRLAPYLIPLLRDPDAEIRRLAAEILGNNEAVEAVSTLTELLEDPDADTQMVAASALNRIGTPEALAALEELRGGGYSFEDADETLREIPGDLFNDFLNNETTEQPKSSSTEAPSRAVTETAEPPVPVQFSAYSPREVAPNVWKPLRAYIYKLSAASEVAADAAREFGDQLHSFREVSRPAQSSIAEGALITATPELAGFQFNPPSAQIAFYDDWQRFDFRLRAISAPADQAVNGRLTFTVEGVIVADVPLAVYVGANAVEIPAPPVTRPIYQSIFCSYSHKDTQIVERVERAYKALGMTFLRDVVTLKSGENWNAELLKMIDRADIFQLFWSPAAAESKYVREEWMRALSKEREGFIRPVFWEQPLAAPPAELAALHFAYQPDLDDA